MKERACYQKAPEVQVSYRRVTGRGKKKLRRFNAPLLFTHQSGGGGTQAKEKGLSIGVAI